jgi:hypothetical protein
MPPVKVLRDPNAGPKENERATTRPAFRRSVSEEVLTITSTPLGPRSLKRGGQQRQWGKCLQLSILLQQIWGPLQREPDLLRKEKGRRRGWKTDLPHSEMKFLQINLHHSKAATAVLCQQLAERMADVALIQESWIHRGQIRGGNNFFCCTQGQWQVLYIYQEKY